MNNSGEKIGIIGILMNILIATPKIILGIISNSISLFTDGINNACDSITGIVTYVGVKISKKPRDSKHPYGHARAEYLAGFLIALFTAVVGVQFFISSFKQLLNPVSPDINSTVRLFLIISIILKFVFFYLNHREYKKYNATIFKANRQDALMDMITSTFILVSSFFFAGHEWMDSVLGIIISMLILYQAYETLKDTLTPLIGPSPTDRDINTVIEALEGSKILKNVHNIYIDRQSMGKAIATADVEVEPNLTIKEAHDEIELITAKLKYEKNIDLIVHVEPILRDEKSLKIINELQNIQGIVGVYDLIMKNENYVTIGISINNLKNKENIIEEAFKILEREDVKKWNVETTVSFKTKQH